MPYGKHHTRAESKLLVSAEPASHAFAGHFHSIRTSMTRYAQLALPSHNAAGSILSMALLETDELIAVTYAYRPSMLDLLRIIFSNY